MHNACLSRYLDHIHLMTYDLHGAWEPKAGHNSPLYPRANEAGNDRYLNQVRWLTVQCV